MPKLPIRLNATLVLQIRAYCQKKNISVESYIADLVSTDLLLMNLLNNDEPWELPEYEPWELPEFEPPNFDWLDSPK